MQERSFFLILLLMICCLFKKNILWADKVFLKDGKVFEGTIIFIEMKQMILRDHSGLREIIPMFSISNVIYDNKEKTFLTIGRNYFRKKNFQKALEYYRKVLEVNSTSQSAKMEILKVREILFQKKRKQSLAKNSSESYKISKMIDAQERLHPLSHNQLEDNEYSNGELGLSIKKKKNGNFYVEDVEADSVANHQHLFINDHIISINKKLIKNLPLEDLSELFYNNTKNQTIQIQREFFVFRRKPLFYEGDHAWIDARFKKTEDGFLITSVKKGKQADLSGLKKDDLVLEIEKESTLTMSVKHFYGKLRGEKGSKVSLMISRCIHIPKVNLNNENL